MQGRNRAKSGKMTKDAIARRLPDDFYTGTTRNRYLGSTGNCNEKAHLAQLVLSAGCVMRRPWPRFGTWTSRLGRGAHSHAIGTGPGVAGAAHEPDIRLAVPSLERLTRRANGCGAAKNVETAAVLASGTSVLLLGCGPMRPRRQEATLALILNDIRTDRKITVIAPSETES